MTAAISTIRIRASIDYLASHDRSRRELIPRENVCHLHAVKTDAVHAGALREASERGQTWRVGLARSDRRTTKCRLMTTLLPLGYKPLNREWYGSLTAKLRTNLSSRTQRFASSPIAA